MDEARLEDTAPTSSAATPCTTTRAGCPAATSPGATPCAVLEDQQHLAVVLLDGLPRERPASPGREAHAQLVQQGPARRTWTAARRPGSLKAKVGEGSLRHSPQWGDIAPGPRRQRHAGVRRAAGQRRASAAAPGGRESGRQGRRPAGPAVHVKDPDSPGVLDIRMPSSYVYLGGRLALHAGARRRRRDQGAPLRQQRPGLEGSGHGRQDRRAEDRPEAARRPPLRATSSAS